MNEEVIRHYDLLIDEGNDPARDPQPLREHMDKWDGRGFIDSMELRPDRSVLEIGVGTGRLALRTAPLCGAFWGIDVSPKTIARAEENLAGLRNVRLICGDFLTHDFGRRFDVIYASLTFMHIREKQRAIERAAALLKPRGRFALSIDRNQSRFIDMGTRKIAVYPDDPQETARRLRAANLKIAEQYDTEYACVFIADRCS